MPKADMFGISKPSLINTMMEAIHAAVLHKANVAMIGRYAAIMIHYFDGKDELLGSYPARATW